MLAARVRYLLAMGLLPGGLVAACKQEAPPTTSAPLGDAGMQARPDGAVAAVNVAATGGVSTGGVSPASSGGVSTGAVATASAPLPSPDPKWVITRRDAGAGVWHVDVKPAEDPRVAAAPPRAECPNGKYCVLASADAGAPAPASAQGASSQGARRPGGLGGSRPGPRELAPAPFGDCFVTADGRPGHLYERFDAETTKLERASTPSACCYAWHEPCPGGRPLRGDDADGGRASQVLRAAPVSRGDWSARVDVDPSGLDAAVRARLADYWLDQASSEHASVASFNRFALQLLALGAPPSMVRATLDAALDEVRHAEICYGLAARYAGRGEGPGRLALPAGELAVDPVTVALETLRDGCVGESVAAELAREAAGLACDPEVAVALRTIAADEERHAELAWRAVAWLVVEHGEPVRAAVEGFAQELDRELASSEDGAARDARDAATCADDVARHGMLGPGRQRARRAVVVREIVLPCVGALLADDRRGAAA